MPLMRRVLTIRDTGLVIDEDKVRAVVANTITNGYAAVAEKDGVVGAYIGGIASEHPFYERQQLHVLGWYSELPGAGFKLFDMLMAWRDENPMIAAVYYYADPNERLTRIMARRGAVVCPSYWFP